MLVQSAAMVKIHKQGINTQIPKHNPIKEEINDEIEDEDDFTQMIVILHDSVKTSY